MRRRMLLPSLLDLAVALAKALLFAANALVASSRSRVLARNTLEDVVGLMMMMLYASGR
jgi:hypothetical protein